jgi:hypothetical protein
VHLPQSLAEPLKLYHPRPFRRSFPGVNVIR